MNGSAQVDIQARDSFTERRNAIRRLLATARPAFPEDASRRSKVLKAKEIWDEARDSFGSIVELYLCKHAAVYDRDLLARVRFHPRVLHEPTGSLLPAMIAPVYNLGGVFVGIHRTYLDRSGRLADVSKGSARRMLGDCFGSYVQLRWPTDSRLVVAKSVEMALSIQQACPDMTVWASMTFGNMKSPLPSLVREITLCADGDVDDPENAAKMVIDAVREHLNHNLRVLIARPSSGAEFSDLISAE
jgi:hypothetical protein